MLNTNLNCFHLPYCCIIENLVQRGTIEIQIVKYKQILVAKIMQVILFGIKVYIYISMKQFVSHG